MKKDLKVYNRKRNFNKTLEPIGKREKGLKKLRFVVQHHIARKDHFDLRLEHNGVMKSWAVPKGPSYNLKDKRLAILVEDHPLSYRNFEGVIPKGEYGGGTVMIFDEGYYEVIDNFNESFKNGILKFKLFGKRLKGLWNLVHFKSDNWLLIKEEDEYFEFRDIESINTSIRTGRTMSEIEKNVKKKVKNNKDTVLGIKITNPDKLIYDSISKMDVINYYKKVSKKMLPFLKYRIISTIRCPEGINGECFFKKHFENEREGIVKKMVKNSSNELEDYYYITNELGLISEAQMNSIEFHTWGSKITNLEYPDIMVFDLDPDEKLNLKKLREGVRDLKSILDELKLKSYLKTSGGKGYHIVVKMDKKLNWEEFRSVAKNIAVLMETKWPNKYTSNIRKDKRKGKIFIDWVRNTRSSTSIAPYSLRARKNAPISMPISWEDLDNIKPNEVTIKNVDNFLRKNPWKNFFE